MRIPFVSIVGTTACDAHCGFCRRWQEPVVEMDPDLTCRTIDQFPKIGPWFGSLTVDITGGQPGLWEGTEIVLDRCARYGLRTTATTSGPSSLAMLKYHQEIQCLRISVHGTAEEQDTWQGFDFYAANLEFLRAIIPERGPRSTEFIFTVRSCHNEESFKSVDRLARMFGIRVIVNPEWGLSLTPELLKLIHHFRKRRLWVCSLTKLRYIQRGGNNQLDPTCAADRMLVLHGNHIIQPCMEHRNSLPSIPLDGIPLQELLGSPERIKWQNETGRWKFCEHCTISCPNMLGLAINCYRRYAAWLHLPTFGQRIRDGLLETFGY